jgi:hypothetical protein
VRASDPKLFNTHDAKGRRKLFATPKTVSPDFAQWPERLLRKWRCRLFEQNARQFIPDRFLNMAGGRMISENAPNQLSFD